MNNTAPNHIKIKLLNTSNEKKTIKVARKKHTLHQSYKDKNDSNLVRNNASKKTVGQYF